MDHIGPGNPFDQKAQQTCRNRCSGDPVAVSDGQSWTDLDVAVRVHVQNGITAVGIRGQDAHFMPLVHKAAGQSVNGLRWPTVDERWIKIWSNVKDLQR